MTPEETIIFSIIAGAVGAFFGAYLQQKGKNLATKEDIAKITRTQEEIKTELANRSHFSRARYDKEVEIYQKVWPKLLNFYDVTNQMDVANEVDRKRFNDARQEVFTVIRDNKPFFPDENCKEFLAFQYLCEDKRFLEMISNVRVMTPEKENLNLELPKQIQSQLEKIEKAIRNRLIKFD